MGDPKSWGCPYPPKSGADTKVQMALGVKVTQERDSGQGSQTRWDPMALSMLNPCWIWNFSQLLASCAADSHQHRNKPSTANPSRSCFVVLDTPRGLHLSVGNHPCCSHPWWSTAAVHHQEGSYLREKFLWEFCSAPCETLWPFRT